MGLKTARSRLRFKDVETLSQDGDRPGRRFRDATGEGSLESETTARLRAVGGDKTLEGTEAAATPPDRAHEDGANDQVSTTQDPNVRSGGNDV